MKHLLLLIALFNDQPVFAQNFTANVMAPLGIGNFTTPHAPESAAAWDQVFTQLQAMKKMGIHAVSTDVWWGVVEGEAQGQFNWEYYDKLSDLIIQAGLKWVPILSLHECGGNVGDSITVLVPKWIWSKYIGQPLIVDENSIKYKSEQNNLSAEYVSPWATHLVINDYASFMNEFQKHFAGKAAWIVEINISLGPSGELRYPSYNSQDQNAGYPTRGSLQAYSDLAIHSFQQAMLTKYGSLDKIKSAWENTTLTDISQVGPPRLPSAPVTLAQSETTTLTTPLDPRPQAEEFFASNGPHTPYGIDFFNWYNASLYQSGYETLSKAIEVFNSNNAPFKGIPLGAKIPGVHWLAGSSRFAEMAAGLITVPALNAPLSDLGLVYDSLISLFKNVANLPLAPPIDLHFTCIEMNDGNGGPTVASLAQSLVKAIAAEAKKLGVHLVKGENALAGSLADPHSWININTAIDQFGYQGITLLRMNDVYVSQVATQALESIIQKNCNTILSGASAETAQAPTPIVTEVH